VVDSHHYSRITVIRTIGQILGIRSMNQKDSAATPMTGAFTQQPDFMPFTAVPNRPSLTLGLKTLPPCGVDTVPSPLAAARPTADVPADRQPVEARWEEWKTHQRLTGPNARGRARPGTLPYPLWTKDGAVLYDPMLHLTENLTTTLPDM
jgi:hypothetical protein